MKVITTTHAAADWARPLKSSQELIASACVPEPLQEWERAHLAALPQALGILLGKPLFGAAHVVDLPCAETGLLAEACALAYLRADEIRKILKCKGFHRVALWRKPPSEDFATGPVTARVPEGDSGAVRGIGFCDDRRVFLAFRGTQYPGDWLYNLSAWMGGDPARHAGFQRGWSEIAPEVNEWLTQVMPTRQSLCLAGHSLGGAIATIAALELADKKYPLRRIVTLGSPRVGASRFSKTYADLSLRDITERYQHGIDIVACWMPPDFFFTHVAPVKALPPRSIIEVDKFNTGQEPAGNAARTQTADVNVNMKVNVKVNVLAPDGTFASQQMAGVVLKSNAENLASSLGLVVGALLFHLGLTAILPFMDKLGPAGLHAYSGGMHHRSAIYASVLSPSRILGDWLNRPMTGEASLLPYFALVGASTALALLLWGWVAALWAAGGCLAATLLMLLVVIVVEKPRKPDWPD